MLLPVCGFDSVGCLCVMFGSHFGQSLGLQWSRVHEAG